MSVVHSDSVASFHLNITMNWCGEGQSGMDDLLKQQEPGTADGYFSEFAKRIADEDIKAEFINRFTRENLIKKFAEGTISSGTILDLKNYTNGMPWENEKIFLTNASLYFPDNILLFLA